MSALPPIADIGTLSYRLSESVLNNYSLEIILKITLTSVGGLKLILEERWYAKEYRICQVLRVDAFVAP